MLQQRNHGGNKRSSGTSRLSNSNLFPLSVDLGPFGAGRSTKSGSDSADAPGADPGYVMQLINDVRKLADVLLHLKEAFRSEENQDCLHQVVHERLEELLRVLKAVICKHPALNSVDILSTAGTVIAKVKGVNFEEVNEENKRNLFREIHSSIDTFAFTFGNVVSDFLMGDVDRGSVLGLSQTQSRSFENLTVETGKSVPEKDDLPGRPRAEDTDGPLRHSDSGVETALLYAKAWSKYTKDVLAWVEKRLSLDIECAKSIAKMAESAKTVANQQEYMPFREIYISAFKNDIEYSQLLLQSASALQSNKFIQPLLARKNDLDKRRKEIKDQWQRELKKMQEANGALKKAKLLRAQRREEYERAHFTTSRVEEEQLSGGGKQLEKRKRLEEEALQKAEEANDLYKACIADVGVKRVDLANAKSETLTQIRELVFQCDLTLKAVTVNWFQMQQALVVSLPVNHQSLCESAKLYEPGQRYADFIRSLPKDRQRGESFSFDVSGPQNAGLPLTSSLTSSTHSLHGNPSLALGDFKDPDEPGSPLYARGTKIGERRSHSSIDIQALRTQGPFRAWSTGSQGGGMCSDSESAGGSSESRSMDSPTTSPGDFKRRLPRTPSTGTMSSADDLDEREPPSPSDIGLGEMTNETTSSPGPFRNAQMSKAAHTHKLRKLRAPSKCRECDGLVVFQGAECEECYLACHKKCLETLAIQCGHKKLQGRLHLFGIDFTQAAKNNPDGIPFIIKKCTSEIENRALNIKGIYRVNGAKSRVEKLCQAFENGKDLVELSDLSPHDISNVLKLYLRQLPEPLILFRYYNDFIGLAKESQNAIADDVDTARRGLTAEQSQISIELNRVLFKIKDLLRQLPPAHYRTLQFLIRHLYRVTEKADENKMTASNLGIIFGPTLIKPRQTDADVSLSSLVDYPYQALIVELLIRYYKKIFDIPLSPLPTLVLAEEKASLLLSVESRQNSQEKEQQLSRHSKSLIDIKEESSKVYKRHSSVFPSNRLLDEVNEVKPNLDRKEFQTAPDSGPEEVNGLPPLGHQEKSSLVLSKSYQSTTKIQLRPLRSNMASRPISVPLDRLHKSAQVNERNSKDAIERGHSPAIQEVTEPDIPSSRVSLYSQKFYIDTQPLRKTPRTTMMTNVPPHSGTTDSGALSVSVPSLYTMGNNSTNTIFPNKPYTVAVKAAGSLKRDVNASECKPKSITLRAPRTLQPPPETFYKPPLPSKTKQSAEVGTKTCAVPSNSTEERGLGVDKPVDGPSLDLEAHSHVSLLQLKTCSSSLEDFSQSEAKPVYQRLRPRRLQEFEHREAHFV